MTIPLHYSDFSNDIEISGWTNRTRIKNACPRDKSYFNPYVQVKDIREDKSKYHYKLHRGVHSPVLCCLWAAPDDNERPAGALSNSADKGICTDGAGSCWSGQQISRLGYWCCLLSCQSGIIWTAQGARLANIRKHGSITHTGESLSLLCPLMLYWRWLYSLYEVRNKPMINPRSLLVY